MADLSVLITLCDDEPDEFAITIALLIDRLAYAPDIVRAIRDVNLTHIIIAGLAGAKPGEQLEFTV